MNINKLGTKRILLWIFFAFYIILPDYFAIEITPSFPLLTASRFILLLLIIKCIINMKISLHIDKYFFAYATILIAVNLFHLLTNSGDAAKAIISVLFEQILMYIVLRNLITSKSALINGLNLIVKTSGVVSILAILEATTSINVFYFLETTNREMLQASYERLGLLRAEASFGHPVYFAVYLVCVLPLTLYFFEKENKKIYALIAILNIIALFCSGSRGGLVALAVIVIISIFLKRNKIKLQYIKYLIAITPIILIIFIGIPQVYDYF